MVIVDYHSEYVDLRIPRLRVTVPKLNPTRLSVEELADAIGVRATADRQRAMMGKVIDRKLRTSQDFWNELENRLRAIAESEKAKDKDRDTASRLLDIMERAKRMWGPIFDQQARDLVDQIRPNSIDVLDVSGFTEAQAQTLVSNLLEDRKNAVRGHGARFGSPVMVAIEEAHVFVPSNESTYCSEVIS
jgi:DNA helicase HerA-like ATPase